MTQIKTTKIPQRQECINKEHPYIGGAKDIIDDTQGLTQAKINEIVLGDAIKVSLSASKASSSTSESLKVRLVATCSVNADITIYKGSKEEANIVGSISGEKTLEVTPVFTPDSHTMLDTYIAEFKIGDLIKDVESKPGIMFVVCGEDWSGAQGESPDPEDTYIKTSPSGTYNVNVDKYVDAGNPGPFHVYFIVPRSINISGATMGGFNFPLQSSVNSTFQGFDCKYYESSNDYPEGTLTIKI